MKIIIIVIMKMKVRFVINHFGSTKAKFFTTTMLTTGDRLNISIEVIILFLKYWRNKLIFWGIRNTYLF